MLKVGSASRVRIMKKNMEPNKTSETAACRRNNLYLFVVLIPLVYNHPLMTHTTRNSEAGKSTVVV